MSVECLTVRGLLDLICKCVRFRMGCVTVTRAPHGVRPLLRCAKARLSSPEAAVSLRHRPGARRLRQQVKLRRALSAQLELPVSTMFKPDQVEVRRVKWSAAGRVCQANPKNVAWLHFASCIGSLVGCAIIDLPLSDTSQLHLRPLRASVIPSQIAPTHSRLPSKPSHHYQ